MGDDYETYKKLQNEETNVVRSYRMIFLVATFL